MFVILLQMGNTEVSAKGLKDNFYRVQMDGNIYKKIRITDPQDIKRYVEENKITDTENLVEIIIMEKQDNTHEVIRNNSGVDKMSLFEYVVKNQTKKTCTDTNCLLREYRRPAGKVSISESVSISNKVEASGKVKAKYVEAALSVSSTETKSFSVSWENFHFTKQSEMLFMFMLIFSFL